MFHIPLTRRITTTVMFAAAVVAASVIGVGSAAAQAGKVRIHNAGRAPISISIPGLHNYLEDINPGETKDVPASNLAGANTKDNNIAWEARLRDLSSTSQTRGNTVCARGVVNWSGTTEVTKCDPPAAAAGSSAAPAAAKATAPVSVTLQQAYGKQWGDICLSRDSSSCCTASERFSGTPDCKTADTCKVSVHICQQMVSCNAALNACKKSATGAAAEKCTSDYKICHDKALTLTN
jgi:hypothetical protein